MFHFFYELEKYFLAVTLIYAIYNFNLPNNNWIGIEGRYESNIYNIYISTKYNIYKNNFFQLKRNNSFKIIKTIEDGWIIKSFLLK